MSTREDFGVLRFGVRECFAIFVLRVQIKFSYYKGLWSFRGLLCVLEAGGLFEVWRVDFVIAGFPGLVRAP